MTGKQSHCGYCGAPFTIANWPRRCLQCGTTTYRNPIPVVVVILPAGDGVIVIRRGIEPARGTLTLPGGYMDIGETWQEAGARELLEETGIAVTPGEIGLYEVMNGLDDTVVIYGLANRQPESVVRPFRSNETEEVVLIREPRELGFPMHTQVVRRYFAEQKGA